MITIAHMQIFLIAIITATACSLPGVFLVLRGVALMSDAISHAILLGIVLMFMLTNSLHSPFMIFSAALTGVATVICTEWLVQTKRLKKDAAIGLVFPLFFSLGVILISIYARNVHLDVDMVLLGEIVFAPFNRLVVCGYDLGPCALWSMSIVLLINSICIKTFYHQLVVSTFDPTLAHILRFMPTTVYYGLMLLTSITAVTAFDVVGSIVVVALMVTPAAIGYLLSDTVGKMIRISLVSAIISSISGCLVACLFDVSIAGSIAASCGLILLVTLIFSPHKGILARLHIKRKYKEIFMQQLIYEYVRENKFVSIDTVASSFGWNTREVVGVIKKMSFCGVLAIEGNSIILFEDKK